MTPQDANAKRGEMTLLDVRRDDELMIAHVEGATHIPLDQLPQRWEELPKDRPVAVLCHHGVRAQKAAVFLEAQGVKAEAIAGGIDAWSQAVDASVPRY